MIMFATAATGLLLVVVLLYHPKATYRKALYSIGNLTQSLHEHTPLMNNTTVPSFTSPVMSGVGILSHTSPS